MDSRRGNPWAGVAVATVLCALAAGVAWAQPRPGSAEAPEHTLRLEGRAIQGGLVVGHADPGSRVTLGERRIRVGRDGTFLIGFAKDAPATLQLLVRRPDGSTQEHTFRVEQRQYGTERIDELPEEEVTPDRATQAELQRALKRIDRVRKRFTPELHLGEGFDWPARGRVTTPFGVRRILSGETRQPHDAIDIAVPQGTQVRAPAAGTVVFTAEDVPLAGHTVVVDHGMGLSSSFLHLSQIRVRPGLRVERGDTLGLTGQTGRTTGAHLHWAVHLLGEPLDPELLVPESSPRYAPTP